MPAANPKVRWSGRARVTRRITSEPDHRGRRTLIAREGEVVSVREAVRREIPEDALEPVGPGGKVALSRYSEATSDPEALSEVEEAARQAERASQQTSDAARSARARGEEPPDEYPKDLGGGHWELSDGTVTDADTSRDDAEAAEAQLSGGGEQGGGPEPPPQSANKAEHVAFAENELGLDVDGMTKDEVIAAIDEAA